MEGCRQRSAAEPHSTLAHGFLTTPPEDWLQNTDLSIFTCKKPNNLQNCHPGSVKIQATAVSASGVPGFRVMCCAPHSSVTLVPALSIGSLGLCPSSRGLPGLRKDFRNPSLTSHHFPLNACGWWPGISWVWSPPFLLYTCAILPVLDSKPGGSMNSIQKKPKRKSSS